MGTIIVTFRDKHVDRSFALFSGYQLVQTALDLKQEYTGEIIPKNKSLLPMKRYEFWDIPSVRMHVYIMSHDTFLSVYSSGLQQTQIANQTTQNISSRTMIS